MIHETFVASDPKSAYDQAVKKYGESVTLVSAKQIKYEDMDDIYNNFSFLNLHSLIIGTFWV